MPQLIGAADVDRKALAETFRALADGLDEDKVLIESAEATQAAGDGIVTATLEVDYAVNQDYKATLHPLQFDTEQYP